MEPGLFEIMYSLRAMRRLKPEPVPEALIWRIVDAATQAPSGGNSQPWRFLVIQDPDLKRFVQQRYRRAWDRYVQANLEAAMRRREPVAADAVERQRRLAQAATHLADHLHEAPVLLLVAMMPRDLNMTADPNGPPRSPAAVYAALHASVFPAVQNVLLACRALGLGATLTTLHLLYEPEIKAELGIPAEVETVALIPIGYPVGKFGPTTGRLPAEDVTFWDGWEQHRARRP